MTSEGPEFSVVIPCYNGAAYLAETLEGVLAQTRPAFEIFVIDDGSKDESAAVAKRFEPNVGVVTIPNGGVSGARNFGAGLATGDWLIFLDADDVWEANHLQSMAAAIAADGAAEVCYSGRRRLVEDEATGTFRLTEPDQFVDPATLPETLMDRCPFTPAAVAVRRSAFLATGGFNGRFNSVEDWDMWLRLSHVPVKFTCAPAATLHYRVHSASATNNPLPVLAKSIGVVEANVLPRLSPLARLTHGRRVISRLQAEAAILVRENGRAGALGLMLRSIAHYPFHDARRYKISLHMLLKGDGSHGK